MKKLLCIGCLGLVALLWSGCVGEPEGLRRTPEGAGPRIVFDLDAKPLPEIPFPNDLATRPDPTSATGRRVNASMIAPTVLEQRVRAKLDRLDGFGTFQPVWVQFDAPLDIGDLLARHRDNLDFSDDAIFLVDVDPRSPGYAQPVLLDIGRGNYPLTLKESDQYFRSDPRQDVGNLLFDTTEEDLNGNGILDPGEDSDDDGVLDHPNVWPPGSDPLDGLMTFYESETNTLVLAPVVPLRERTRYAVVLTSRLTGRDGQPVRSPFAWVNHLAQSEDLEVLREIFALWRDQGTGLDVDDVAFAWVYTTQSVTADLVAIREGLYGFGPLGWLADAYPARARPRMTKNRDQDPPYYVLEADILLDVLVEVLEDLGVEMLGEYMDLAEPIIGSFDYVDYFAGGSFESPDFVRTGEDGLDPENLHRENFAIDLQAGTAEAVPGKVSFFVAVPKETERFKPPFPVVIYCHSYSSFGAEGLGFAGFMARRGMATIGMDAWGHGLPVDEALEDIIRSAGHAYGFDPFTEILMDGRARDLNGNGAMDSGGDYWTGYGFHVRDVVRQSVADHLQLVRMLTTFDGETRWDLDQDGDGEPDLAGDFNGDGVVDLGGPGVPYFAWGQSGGGIHSGILAPLEPRIIAAAPTAGGGAMSSLSLRTDLGAVRRSALLRIMAPLVVGEPAGDGVRVMLIVPLASDERRLVVDEVEGIQEGDEVVVLNLGTELMPKEEEHHGRIHAGLRFRLSVEADKGDRLEIRFLRDGEEIARLDRWGQDAFYFMARDEQGEDIPTYLAGEELVTPTEGYGKARNTPGFRRMVGLFQMIIDPADPGNYAPHYFQDPLEIRPEGKTVTNLLEIACLADQTVPIQAQTTFGRAAGVIPYLEEDPRYGLSPNDWLIANYVYEGLTRRGRFPENDIAFDPDDLDEGLDGHAYPATLDPGSRLRVKVPTDTGVSGIRFAYMRPHGQHGVFPTGEESGYDIFTHFANLVAHFFYTGGTEILDDVCLQDSSCDF